jgi:hypothetical protein
LIGTAEFIYNRDVNGIYYINANQAAPDGNFVGADNRPRWTSTAARKIHQNVDNAVVLKNQSEGHAWNISASLEKPFSNNWFAKVGYNYGETKNTVDPGSIAFGSWNNNQHPGDPNNPGLGFSTSSPGHRIFTAVSYRAEYFDFGATTISLFWEGLRNTVNFVGNYSYVFGGDMNGDGGTSNDLIYIHRNMTEMNFEEYTSGGRTFTAQEQAEAWNAYIEQDDYLSENRGKYAERNAVFLPMVFRADLSIMQEVFTDLFNRRNTLQFRIDILNIGNLLNKEWGVGQRLVHNQPLIPASSRVDGNGEALYRLRSIGGELMSESFEQTAGIDDVYRIQFSLRYIFN